MSKKFGFWLGRIGMVVLFIGIMACSTKAEDKMSEKTVYDFTVKNIDGKDVNLSEYRGKVLLIVNVASECGYTKQYKGLQFLYDNYKDMGLEVLGFPCNQFGSQEPGTEKEIKSFCEANFGVNFPMFSKIDVNGDKADPLYVYLKSEGKGILGTEAIKWNFAKFLVDKNGKVVERFGSQTTPESLANQIEILLAQ